MCFWFLVFLFFVYCCFALWSGGFIAVVFIACVEAVFNKTINISLDKCG